MQLIISNLELLNTIHVQLTRGDNSISFHLAHEDEMIVTWVTLDDAKGSIAEYGCAKSDVMNKVAKGFSTLFKDGGKESRTMHIHRVTMTGLLPDHEYGEFTSNGLSVSCQFTHSSITN